MWGPTPRKKQRFLHWSEFGADGRAHWKLPADGRKNPATELGKRHRDSWRQALEIRSTKASWSGTQENKLANVNRWRGQFSLLKSAATTAEFRTNRKAGERPVTIVDMRAFKSGGNDAAIRRRSVRSAEQRRPTKGSNRPANLPDDIRPLI